MALLSLRKASDSTSFVIEERDIIVGYDSTNGTKIEYVNNQSGRRDSVEVSDTTASITEVSESLILLSFADYPNDYGFINIDRIYSINDNASTQAVIIYDRGTTQKGKYVMSESRTEVLTAMYEKQGNYTYEVDDYNALTIRLKAAAGDVTAKFVSGDVITVYGALDGNNDTYVVDTVSFGGGKTTITLLSGVADDTDTTGRIMVKSLSNAELETAILGITDGNTSFDTISEKTSGAGVTIDGVLLKDGLVNREVASVTTTGVSQTLAAGYNDVILLTTTTGTDLAKLSNTAINIGHKVALIYVAEGAGADELVLSKLNAGDGIGFTTITFSTLGDTATLCWSGSAWFIVSLNGAVAA